MLDFPPKFEQGKNVYDILQWGTTIIEGEEEELTYSRLRKLFQMSLCQVLDPFATSLEVLQLENGKEIGGVTDGVIYRVTVEEKSNG